MACIAMIVIETFLFGNLKYLIILGQKPEFLQMRQHKQLISEVMREMSQSGMHTDTTMIAGGQKINVHRLVLAACSPFLKVR